MYLINMKKKNNNSPYNHVSEVFHNHHMKKLNAQTYHFHEFFPNFKGLLN